MTEVLGKFGTFLRRMCIFDMIATKIHTGVRAVFNWEPRALAVLDTLEKAGFQTVLVGGCVRDYLLGKPSSDYDAATAALPEQMLEVFSDWKVIETGRKHGTLTIMSDGLPVEVTTFRTEGAYTDHRHPDGVSFTTDLKADLARRDFTINAMAWGRDGLTDLFEGQEDLRAGILRCVGDPEKRFNEDAIRILRCLRFAARPGFWIHPDTEAALKNQVRMLDVVSRERVTDEFLKLICQPDAERILLEYPEVVRQIIPEMTATIGFDQRTPYHCYDVYTHSVKAMGQVPPRKTMRLAALLHDIAKPMTYSPDEQGVGHFPDHPKLGAELADQALRNLRLDNHTREQVVTLIARHGMRLPAEEKVVKRWLSRLGPELFFELMTLDRADNSAKRPDMVRPPQHWLDLDKMARQVLAQADCLSLKDLAVNGRDALNAGLKGPAIGRALNELLEDVVEGRKPNDRDVLLHALNER